MTPKRLRLTGYTDVIRWIKAVDKLDLANCSDNQIAVRMRRLTSIWFPNPLILHFRGVYRARKNPDTRPFLNVSQLWYPPADLVNIGRFNQKGEPVFYASNVASAAVLEVRPSIGDTITIIYAINPDPWQDVLCSVLALDTTPAALNNLPQEASLSANSEAKELFKEFVIDRKWHKIDDYISRLVVLDDPLREPQTYRITSAISNLLLLGTKGAVYPSVAAARECSNFFCAPATADALFHPCEAYMVRIDEWHPGVDLYGSDRAGTYAMTYVARSEEIQPDGTIVWREVKPISSNALGRANEDPGFAWNGPLLRQALSENGNDSSQA